MSKLYKLSPDKQKFILTMKCVKVNVLNTWVARKHIADHCDATAVVSAVAANDAWCFSFCRQLQLN